MGVERRCPNCKAILTKEGHYVPPSLGEDGFFLCEKAISREGVLLVMAVSAMESDAETATPEVPVGLQSIAPKIPLDKRPDGT